MKFEPESNLNEKNKLQLKTYPENMSYTDVWSFLNA